MPSILSLIKKLRVAYPDVKFAKDQDFHWSYETRTVSYQIGDSEPASAYLLHELAHALLDHHLYNRDIELLAMERDAWHYALHQLASVYEVKISDEVIETAMDSYRDWLHARSVCPNCQASGVQTGKSLYQCVICRHEWRVNEARICALRRYSIQK